MKNDYELYSCVEVVLEDCVEVAWDKDILKETA